MMYLLNRFEKLMDGGVIGLNNTLESTQSLKLNGLIEHTIDLPYQTILDECAYFGLRDPLDDRFWIYKIVDRTKHAGHMELKGIYKLFDDLKGRGYIKDIRPHKTLIGAPMGEILKGTGWTIGTNTVVSTASTNFYYTSKLEAFWEALSLWGAEFVPEITFKDGAIFEQKIHLAPEIGGDFGRAYVYGDKLLSVEAQSDESTIYTAFVGRGKGEELFDEHGASTGGFSRKILFTGVSWSVANGDPVDKPLGQEYVELPNRTVLFGYSDGTPRTTIVEFSECEDPAELLRLTYEFALENSRPKAQFRAVVSDGTRVSLGEKCWIKRMDLGITYQTRVFELTRSFLNPMVQEIRFGDKITQSRAEQQIQYGKKLDESRRKTESYIGQVGAHLEGLWRNDDGYNYELKAGNPYGLPAGYYSLNRSIDGNPTQIIGVSAGRLVIANKRNPDNTWKWSTFGDGDGFVADLIRTGVLRGGRVFWNLETGELDIGDGALHYSPATGLTLSEQIKDELKGKSIDRIVSEYALSTDENAPASGWAEERPTGDGVLWRRYKFIYTDHTSTTTEPEKDSGAAIEKSKETAIQTALSIVQGELTAAQEAANIYADGVVTEAEARQKKDVETRIAELQALLMSDSETRVQEAIDYIDTQMADLQGYIWASGNVIHIGQKGSAMAVQITNKEIKMLVNGVVMSTWDNSAMHVDRIVTKALVVADGNGEEKFQFVHRRPNGVDHLTLMYMGG